MDTGYILGKDLMEQQGWSTSYLEKLISCGLQAYYYLEPVPIFIDCTETKLDDGKIAISSCYNPLEEEMPDYTRDMKDMPVQDWYYYAEEVADIVEKYSDSLSIPISGRLIKSVSAERQIADLMSGRTLTKDNAAGVIDKLKVILRGYDTSERNKIIARHVDESRKRAGKKIFSHPRLGELLADAGSSREYDASKSRGQRAREQK